MMEDDGRVPYSSTGSFGMQSFWQPLKQHFWSSVQSLSRWHSSPLKSHIPSSPFHGAGHRPGLSTKVDRLFDVFIIKATRTWQTDEKTTTKKSIKINVSEYLPASHLGLNGLVSLLPGISSPSSFTQYASAPSSWTGSNLPSRVQLGIKRPAR